MFVIRSRVKTDTGGYWYHTAWFGYTKDLKEAARFTESEAMGQCDDVHETIEEDPSPNGR